MALCMCASFQGASLARIAGSGEWRIYLDRFLILGQGPAWILTLTERQPMLNEKSLANVSNYHFT